MEHVPYLFEQYDSDKDGKLTRNDFFSFLYELGKQETIEDQFEDCFTFVSRSQRGFIVLQDFLKGVPDLYDCNFIPDVTQEKSLINAEDSPHYHLYQAIQRQDFEDFYELEDDYLAKPQVEDAVLEDGTVSGEFSPVVDTTALSLTYARAKFGKIADDLKASGVSKVLPNTLMRKGLPLEDPASRKVSLSGNLGPASLANSPNVSRKMAVGEDSTRKLSTSNFHVDISGISTTTRIASPASVRVAAQRKSSAPKYDPASVYLNQPPARSSNPNIVDESIFERMKREVQDKKPAVSSTLARKAESKKIESDTLTRKQSTRNEEIKKSHLGQSSLRPSISDRTAGNSYADLGSGRVAEDWMDKLKQKEAGESQKEDQVEPDWMKQLKKDKLAAAKK